MRKPLLVYVHIPFCTSKCTFCDWVQEVPASELRLPKDSPRRVAYVEALCQQLKTQLPVLMSDGYTPEIMYWGGGTASILSEGEVHLIAEVISKYIDIPSLREVTIEASPETLSREKLHAFRIAGFRRISIGVQSFDDDRLRQIGRMHLSKEAVQSVQMAHGAGFEEINIDLISGFPGETLKCFEDSLRRALALNVHHISLYPYRPVPGTAMFRQLRRGIAGKTALDEQLSAYRLGRQMLQEAGFPEYAMGHFGAKQCYSDLAYFRLEMDWAGFGSGATSLLSQRFLSTRRGNLDHFIKHPCEYDEECPAGAESIASRLIYQALTTFEGISARHWTDRTGTNLTEVCKQSAVMSLLEYLGRACGGLDANPIRICLPQEHVAEAFIRLLHDNAPPSSQARQGVAGLLGGY